MGRSAAVGTYDLADLRRGAEHAHEGMPDDEVVIEDQVAYPPSPSAFSQPFRPGASSSPNSLGRRERCLIAN